MNNTNEMNSTENNTINEDDIQAEYDFSSGIRGKHYQAYQQGHTVKIHQADGTVTIQHFTLEDGAIFLEPDVRAYFPDAKAVNKALRGLIALLPKHIAVVQDE